MCRRLLSNYAYLWINYKYFTDIVGLGTTAEGGRGEEEASMTSSNVKILARLCRRDTLYRILPTMLEHRTTQNWHRKEFSSSTFLFTAERAAQKGNCRLLLENLSTKALQTAFLPFWVFELHQSCSRKSLFICDMLSCLMWSAFDAESSFIKTQANIWILWALRRSEQFSVHRPTHSRAICKMLAGLFALLSRCILILLLTFWEVFWSRLCDKDANWIFVKRLVREAVGVA